MDAFFNRLRNWFLVPNLCLLSSFTNPSPYEKAAQPNGVALDIKTEHGPNRSAIIREFKALWGSCNWYYTYFFIPVHNPMSLHMWTPPAKIPSQPPCTTPPPPQISCSPGNSERWPLPCRHLYHIIIVCSQISLYIILFLPLNCEPLEGRNPILFIANAWNILRAWHRVEFDSGWLNKWKKELKNNKALPSELWLLTVMRKINL